MKQVYFCHGEKDYIPNPTPKQLYDHHTVVPDTTWGGVDWDVYNGRGQEVLHVSSSYTFFRFRWYV